MNVGEQVTASAATGIVGRDRELKALREVLRDSGPSVAHVHGQPGIGKSALLQAFAAEARQRGVAVVMLDCREVEPTPVGFAGTVARKAGIPEGDAEEIATRLGSLGSGTVLALDSYEAFRLLDTWMRLNFVPALPEQVRVIFCGRHHPPAGWRFGGWEKLALDLPLAPLGLRESVAVLADCDLDPAKKREIAAAVHGHPLALRLVASMLSDHEGLELPEATLQRVMIELTGLYLAEIREEDTRRLVEGASVVRRVTVPVLAAMFPDLDAERAYRRLEQLDFTETVLDGLRLHDGVREAIAQTLEARDPELALSYRREAWRALKEQVGKAGRSTLWRCTADMLYLIENPVIREAFFPSGASQVAVETARRRDRPSIESIAQTHEGPDATASLMRWFDAYPDSFVVVRGFEGGCEGFCCRVDPAWVERSLLRDDPLTATWLSHLEENPIPQGGRVLFIRRWLDRTMGEQPGDTQAACWLDLKRTYMEMRPELQRVYLTVVDLVPYAAAARQLGIRVIEDQALELDGHTYHTAMLDFGSGSVDGWLAGLAAAELGLPQSASLLDREARELVLGDRRVDLTPLEFGVLSYLCDREGSAVSREELLREVWRTDYTGWSNKVDAVVAGLRQKLEDRDRCLETVRGVGYRYRSSALK